MQLRATSGRGSKRRQASPGHDLLYTSSDLSRLDFPAKNPLSQQLAVAQNTTSCSVFESGGPFFASEFGDRM
jgi:hypothetical protein